MSKLPDRGIGHPAPDLEFNTMTLPAGTEIHRIHNGKWGASGFNPGASIDPKIGNVGSRFAPFKSAGAFIPTLYGGDSLGCAAFETIFHDIDPLAKFKTVSMSSLSSLKYSVLTLTKDVEATRLFSPDLKRLSLARQDLIDCPSSRYSQTRLWAQAMYDSPAAPSGLVWTSRQFDEGRAYIFFGSRIPPKHFEVQTSVSIVNDAVTLDKIRDFGDLAGITIVHS